MSAEQDKNSEIPSVPVENAKEYFDTLFAEYDEEKCKSISREERESKELVNKSLVYGEVIFETVEQILSVIKEELNPLLIYRGGVFYDIGSGCGKVVMAAALLHDFDKCHGIEILEGLSDVSLAALKIWNTEMVDNLPIAKGGIDIEFLHGDATKLDWSDATIVFTNSTCFADSLMEKIAKKADQLSEGSLFVSVTKPLKSNRWKIKHEKRYKMSWGSATVIIQKKIA